MTETTPPAILYVDDERNNRVVFKYGFPDFRIILAEGPLKALEILEQEDVAAIVSDQRMPDMTGIELLRRARAMRPAAVRVILTAYDDEGPITVAMHEGVVGRYLVKPYDSEELREILSWAVEAHQLGLRGGELQRRLMQAERLATLGAVAAGAIHDSHKALAPIHRFVERLETLIGQVQRSQEALHRRIPGAEELKPLDALLEELPELVDDIRYGVQLAIAIDEGARNTLKGQSRTRDPCHPGDVIRYVAGVCRHRFEAHGNVLRVVTPHEMPDVQLSFAELTQVLINLLTNAADALDQIAEGDGPARGLQAHLTVRVQEREVEFEIRDQGPGVPRDTRDELFRPFVSTKLDGSGLGLHQCRRIAHAVGGRLEWVDVETGAAIRLVVPRV